MRGLDVWLDHTAPAYFLGGVPELRDLMRERAANLAQALASRTLSAATADRIFAGDPSLEAGEVIRRDLNGE